MPTAPVALIGSGTAEWAPTPVVADADHWTLLVDPDTANFVQCGGHVAGFIEEVLLDAGPPNIQQVTNIHLDMSVFGDVVTNIPAVRAEVWVAGVLVGFRSFGLNTGAAWVPCAVNIPIIVLGDSWYTGPRMVRFVPLDGDAGYEDVPEEV